VDELREHGAAGTPAEVVDVLGRYAEAGATRFSLQVLDLADLDHWTWWPRRWPRSWADPAVQPPYRPAPRGRPQVEVKPRGGGG
jgi:hypothetical protein